MKGRRWHQDQMCGTISPRSRDVLAIPISTVAAESAFSTSGHILDDFGTSLTPFMLEALVCTQDGLRRTTPINIQENIEELAMIEADIVNIHHCSVIHVIVILTTYLTS
jgi:hypothetical protein